ncbi:hypothetical protein TKK_0015866 [Trichogramma kaykai]|uniref:28S ribosomal protein S18c, mitochondrial n=1 Tax=Trichogramma kaykai TaxID=54128 RepID=A0ABD2W8W8_9HYME
MSVMHIMLSLRIVVSNRVGMIVNRNLHNPSRVTSSIASPAKTSEDRDAPIEMENPYTQKKEKCILCKYNIEPDYKNVRLISQFQSRYTGRVYAKHITGLCQAQQEKVEREIHKAQHAGMMGYYTKEAEFVNDPMLFDIDNPFRPHKY